MSQNEEILPIVDVSGHVIGKASRSECHSGSMLLHPVVHLHVFNRNGDLLLQKRSMAKKIQPGKWDTAVGGHVDWGEDVHSALVREAREEIGLNVVEPKPLFVYEFTSPIEHELINGYTVTVSDDFVPQAEEHEIDDLRFWSIDDISAAIGKDILTPNFETEFLLLRRVLKI